MILSRSRPADRLRPSPAPIARSSDSGIAVMVMGVHGEIEAKQPPGPRSHSRRRGCTGLVPAWETVLQPKGHGPRDHLGTATSPPICTCMVGCAMVCPPSINRSLKQLSAPRADEAVGRTRPVRPTSTDTLGLISRLTRASTGWRGTGTAKDLAGRPAAPRLPGARSR